MAEIDVLAQLSPHRSALAARQFVHRLAPSQVLLTDVRATGPDEFRAVARWPRAQAAGDAGGGRGAGGAGVGVGVGVGGRNEPMLVAETLRQLGIYLPLRFYGVTADSRLLVEELRFALEPAGQGGAGAHALRGSDIGCTVRAVRRNAAGADSGHMRSLDLQVRLSADGREIARADLVARVLCPAAYRAVRHRGHAAAAQADGAPAHASGDTPSVRGGSSVHDAAAIRDGSSARGASSAGGASSARGASSAGDAWSAGDASASGDAPSAGAPGLRLTSVDPARVGAVRPRDVLVAVDDRGGVRIAPTDPHHPFFHDHPSDQITGMTLVGALQQTAALQANEPRLRLRACTLRALRFTEPSPPPAVEIGPAGRFEIRQRGTVTATGEAHFDL